jgi:hypothetical protein
MCYTDLAPDVDEKRKRKTNIRKEEKGALSGITY